MKSYHNQKMIMTLVRIETLDKSHFYYLKTNDITKNVPYKIVKKIFNINESMFYYFTVIPYDSYIVQLELSKT